MQEVDASHKRSRCFRLKHQRLLLSSKWEDLENCPCSPRALLTASGGLVLTSGPKVWPLARPHCPARRLLLCRSAEALLEGSGP